MSGRHSARPSRLRIALALGSLLLVAAAVAVIAVPRLIPPTNVATAGAAKKPGIIWGVTFSQKMSGAFHLKWRRNYDALVQDLKPANLRLVAYWDLVERQPGQYDFSDMDYQFAEAEKYHIPVVLAIGQKVPRWPEYHVPSWVPKKNDQQRQQRLLEYLSAVVEHYKGSPVLLYWQVENEPFNGYGGYVQDKNFLKKEIDLVRRADPKHKIMTTDGGEFGEWTTAAKLGDVFGHSIYRQVYSKTRGSFVPSRTPAYYEIKADTTKLMLGRPNEEIFCSELQTEPWGHTLNNCMTIEEQTTLFPPQAFDDSITFARKTGDKRIYLWGVEWWYYLKQNGDPRYWDKARQVFQGD